MKSTGIAMHEAIRNDVIHVAVAGVIHHGVVTCPRILRSQLVYMSQGGKVWLPTVTGCTNVLHDEVDCFVAAVGPEDRCESCADAAAGML